MRSWIRTTSPLPSRPSVARPGAALAVSVCLGVLAAPPARAAGSGADGPFKPTASTQLQLPPDGIFQFTDIEIPAGVTVTFRGNAANTPVFLQATGDVRIDGEIAVSRWRTSNGPGPGSFAGGVGGIGDETCVSQGLTGCRAATPGEGLAGGNAGPPAAPGGIKSTPGNSGSGGGMATAGLAGTRYGGSAPPSAIAAFPTPLAGGSGGGGGGGWMFFGVELGGGSGGGGGGAIRIDASGRVDLGPQAAVLADGANGGWAFTNVGGTGGPGGGGSGGAIEIVGSAISVDPGARVHARGGFGGGLSTQPYDINPPTSWISYENGARGGFGWVRLEAPTVDATFGSLDAGSLGIPGSTPADPLLPIDALAATWEFAPVLLSDAAMGRAIPIWFDPQPSAGFDYRVAAGPRFGSLTLPDGLGDDLYDLYLENPASGALELALQVSGGDRIDLTALQVFGDTSPSFPDGVDRFQVLGIETGVDLGDPTAFPTGLTFAGPGSVVVQMTAVPEPATAAGVMLGLALLSRAGDRRRRAR